MNIFNVDALDYELQERARLETPRIRAWLLGNFRNYALRHGERAPLHLHSLPGSAPKWAVASAQRGDLYVLSLNAVTETLPQIIDYLLHLDLQDKDFSRMSVPDAFRHQETYHRKLREKYQSDLEEDGIETYLELDGGYRWVRVFGEQSLKREGQMMGHCVGDYYKRVKMGRCSIYSLRDVNGRPHVTVEVAHRGLGDYVEQIKGRGNGAIADTYSGHCVAFLAFKKVHYIDLDSCGATPAAVLSAVLAKGWGDTGGVVRKRLDVKAKRLGDTGELPVLILTPTRPLIFSSQGLVSALETELALKHYGLDNAMEPPIYVLTTDCGVPDDRPFRIALEPGIDRHVANLSIHWPTEPEVPKYPELTNYADVAIAFVEALAAEKVVDVRMALLSFDHPQITQYLKSSLRAIEYGEYTLLTGPHQVIHGIFSTARTSDMQANAALVGPKTLLFTLTPTLLKFRTAPTLNKAQCAALRAIRGKRAVSVAFPTRPRALRKLRAKLGIEAKELSYADKPSPVLTALRKCSVKSAALRRVVAALDSQDDVHAILNTAFPLRREPKAKPGSKSPSTGLHRTYHTQQYNEHIRPLIKLLCIALMADKRRAVDAVLSDPNLVGSVRWLHTADWRSLWKTMQLDIQSIFPQLLPFSVEQAADLGI